MYARPYDFREAAVTETPFDAETEFDSQLDRLVQLGYPALAGLTESAFRELVARCAPGRSRAPPACPAPPTPGCRSCWSSPGT
ncbi:hypothetical protein NKG94_36700 [Micromonospora sp. M12]